MQAPHSPIAESSALHYHRCVRTQILQYIREHQLIRAGHRVAVAVSGGADSVALLRVLLQLRDEVGIVLFVAHVNHELRGEASDADQAFVADLAAQHQMEFLTFRGDVGKYAAQRGQGIEETARQMRYEWLDSQANEHRLDVIATGHTLDDQAETVLMKFLRGAGTCGLAGIYPKLNSGIGAHMPFFSSEFSGTPIVRPLLGVTRAEVETYLTSLGQTWREDESNLDHRFARNRVRHELLPLLEREYNPNIRQILSDTGEVARAEEEYWEAQAGHEVVERLTHAGASLPPGLKPGSSSGEDGTAEAAPFHPSQSRIPGAGSTPSALPHGEHPRIRRSQTAPLRAATREAGPVRHGSGSRGLSLLKFSELPLALQRRVLRNFAQTEGLTLDFQHVESLQECCEGEAPATELPGGWIATRNGDFLELRPPRPEKTSVAYEHRLPVPGELHLPEIGATLRAVMVKPEFAAELEPGTLLSADLLGRELTVRNWKPGDRFWPAHRGSEEKLKRLFAERHIPAEQRPSWPVGLSGGQIVWVRGLPVSQLFAWNGSGDAVAIESVDVRVP